MLIIFIVLSGVWVTCGTIFVVREIEVVDATPTANVLTDTEKDEIVAKSGLRGKNILFNLNQQAIAQSVKSANYMVKLQSVTAEFPNRVVLKVARRLPLYHDDKYFYDAEMCRVDGTNEDGCVDITKAGIKLANNDLSFGDVAVGKESLDKCKINQLKVVATYFLSLKGFKIWYDDDAAVVGAHLVCLMLKINDNVTFKIKIEPSADFLYALEYVDQIYRDWGKRSGTYTMMYHNAALHQARVEIADESGKIIGDCKSYE